MDIHGCRSRELKRGRACHTECHLGGDPGWDDLEFKES